MTAQSTLINLMRGHALMTSRMSYVIVVLLLLVAAVLRTYDLANFPPGFSEDEIINIRLVDNVRQGDIFVFYPGEDGGREGMYHVIVAFVTAFVGEGTIGFRIVSVWLGMLSIAIVYTLGHHLFNPIVGVVAASTITANMSVVLLSRAVTSDATALFLVSAIMLALARSLPVYRRTRVVTSNVVSFAALGGLLGISFYLHPSSLFIVLGAMLYIGHLLYIRNAMFRQRRSYTGFAILLMLIISMPYLISSINLPQYSAGQRVLAQYSDGALASAADALLSIVGQGDMDPRHNLPGRSLGDALSAMFILVGIGICIRRRHRPRFMLVLIMFVITLPAALIVENSPNFFRISVTFPFLAIFLGIGIYALIRTRLFVDVVFRRLAVAGLLLLLCLGLLWTWQDLFVEWRNNDQVIQAVNGDLGQIAHYLDAVGDTKPVVFCNSDWLSRQPEPHLTRTDKTLLMMNRKRFVYHEADCSRSLLLTNGGESQFIVFFDATARSAVHPYLSDWLGLGEAVAGKLPRDAVFELDAAQALADRAGVFTTTAPVSYAPEVAEPVPLAPPIRFGDNLTFLGYEPDVTRIITPGGSVEVITFWRAEGDLPADLTLFHHLLSDPITMFSNNDVIYVNPALINGRDVFIQATMVDIPPLARPGQYIVSVGAYRRQTPDQPRLPVLHDDQLLGDRIFLYDIEVLAPPDSAEGGG